MAGCTQDESPNASGILLPPDTYPLQIASFTVTADGQAWTRVSENTDGGGSHWDGGETINVCIGNGTPGTYTLAADGTISSANPPAYWQNTKPGQTVTAWYPAASGLIDLSDQSQGLAYVLQARTTADFNQAVSLNFTHQLAKVCVTLTAADGYTFTDPAVCLHGITSCMLGADGAFSPSEETGYITTHRDASRYCYEATLWPQTLGENFIRLTDGEKEGFASLGSSSGITLQAGNMYTFNITVNDKELILTPASDIPGWDEEETEL